MIDLDERELVVIALLPKSSRAGSKGVFRDSFASGEVHKLCPSSQSYVSKMHLDQYDISADGVIVWRYVQPLLDRSELKIMARIVLVNFTDSRRPIRTQ